MSLPSTCGRHRHGVERLRGADAVEIDRHVGGARVDREHRHRIGVLGAGAALLALAFALDCCCCLLVGLRRPSNSDADAGHDDEADEGDALSVRGRVIAACGRSALGPVHGGDTSRRRAPGTGSARPAGAQAAPSARLSSAWNSVCWVCSTVTRSTVPSRRRVSAISKARREAVDHVALQPLALGGVLDRDQRVLDVGEA